ncbi:hypothetical protein GGE06_005782 [Streptomyces sp. SFB5A]|uniref:Uncharacterized protein n=1 Tax=Streptomyces nymphaeiformis TaxID=2663842 RepID=A0A7W7U559_9ACTN|nr:hypothetical protein [Streptomyces nymphaeiformis]
MYIRGAGQLLGAGLQLLPGLFDDQVLRSDVLVPLGQEGGLLLQLGVGTVEFLLPGL